MERDNTGKDLRDCVRLQGEGESSVAPNSYIRAQQIITVRQPIIAAWFDDLASVAPAWQMVLESLNAENQCQLYLDVEQRLSRSVMRDQFLLPLAVQLGLSANVEEFLLARCWSRGWFDRVRHSRSPLQRPSIEAIATAVRPILAASPFVQARTAALLDQGICRDKKYAQYVVDELDRYNNVAASRARGVVLAYVGLGSIGLLTHIEHPCGHELMLLEREAPRIAYMTESGPEVVTELRKDICALHDALQTVRRGRHGKHTLWQSLLLTEPPHSQERVRHAAHVLPERRAEVVALLSQIRPCTAEEAVVLLDVLLERGLPGLIDVRCQLPAGSYVEAQIKDAVGERCAALHPAARADIEQELNEIVAAGDATQLPLPLGAILRDLPSSHRRRRASRRLTFGFGARAPRAQVNAETTQGPTNAQEPRDTAFVAAYANRTGYTGPQARRRLRDLVTYGPALLLDPKLLRAALDPRILPLIDLARLGHIDGTVYRSRLLRSINAYAERLGQPALSMQLLEALMRIAQKPRYWHGGQGEAVARVRQKAGTLQVEARRPGGPSRASTPHRRTKFLEVSRLHQSWVLVPVPLQLRLVDTGGWPLGQTAHALLVLEQASGRPMACWVSPEPPGPREIALAMYQAIWHTGMLDWPLRGVPDVLEVPQSLAEHGLGDLERAAALLLTEIQTIPDRRWRTNEVVAQLEARAPAHVRQALAPSDMVCDHVQHELERLLYTTWFPHHRSAPVPAALRTKGVAMPGFDTPAAGWLLPVTGQVQIDWEGVVDGAILYERPIMPVGLGRTLNKRAYPYGRAGQEYGIFIEIPGEMLQIEYVPSIGRIRMRGAE